MYKKHYFKERVIHRVKEVGEIIKSYSQILMEKQEYNLLHC